MKLSNSNRLRINAAISQLKLVLSEDNLPAQLEGMHSANLQLLHVKGTLVPGKEDVRAYTQAELHAQREDTPQKPAGK